MKPFEPRIPVPEIFWSFETGQPMKRCSLCNCSLMEKGKNYLIEKAFNNSETLFEVALCIECYSKCSEEISQKSTENIQRYFEEHANLEERFFRGMEEFGTRHEKWMAHCMIKGYPVQECGEYQIYGYCSDSELIFNGAPYMLSGEVVEEITDLLSRHTLDILADLSDQLLGRDMPQNLLLI